MADDSVQWPVAALRADWTRSGFTSPYAILDGLASEITVERSITGDLPAEVSLVEGYASAELTATLAGVFPDGTADIADLLAPYRPESPLYGIPLYGAPITCDMGLLTDTGPAMIRQFTGTVRSVKVDSATKTVVLTALDGADSLRQPITLPQYGQPRGAVISHDYKFDINSQAVIDYVLRQNGIYASPPPASTAQLSITGHGWMTAEIGRSSYPSGTATPIPDDSWWVPGPFGMLAVRGIWDNSHDVTIECTTENQFDPVAGNGAGIAMWVYIGDDVSDINTSGTASQRRLAEFFPTIDASIGMDLRVTRSLSTLTLVADLSLDGSSYVTAGTTLTNPPQWIHIGAHFQFGTSGTTTVRLRVNGTTFTAAGANPSSVAYLRDQAQVIAHTDCRHWSNLQIWYDYNSPSGAWPGETWIPQATIGAGYNRLSHLPDVVNADSWQLIRDITGAEYGIAGFTPDGVFEFQPRQAGRDTNTIAGTITADRSLLDLTTEVSSDAIRNIVTTETTAAYLNPAAVVKSQDVTTWETPVGIRKYKVPLPYGTIGPVNISAILDYTTASWVDTLLEGYVAVESTNPATEIPGGSSGFVIIHFEHVTDYFALQAVPDPGISATASPTGNRIGILTVENRYTTGARFATTNGSPALRVLGWALVNEPALTETIRNVNSVTALGPRVFAIPSSPWRQLIGPLRPVASQLLTQLTNPVPVVDSMSVLGDPARSLGDIVRVMDSQGQGGFKAAVVRIVRTLNDQGLVDTLTVRPVAPPGLGITDDNELGLADLTLIAGP